MRADIITPGPGVRMLVPAIRAAVKTGTTRCNIRLVDGVVIDFVIAEVFEDSLLGARVDRPQAACLVNFINVSMIEFG
jgi:hypothetical protein